MYAGPTLEKLTRAAVLSRRRRLSRRLSHRHLELSSLPLSSRALPPALHLAPALPLSSSMGRFHWPNLNVRRAVDRAAQGRPGTEPWRWVTATKLDRAVERNAFESMHNPGLWRDKLCALRRDKTKRVSALSALLSDATERPLPEAKAMRAEAAVVGIRRQFSAVLEGADYVVLMVAAARAQRSAMLLELWEDAGMKGAVVPVDASALCQHALACGKEDALPLILSDHFHHRSAAVERTEQPALTLSDAEYERCCLVLAAAPSSHPLLLPLLRSWMARDSAFVGHLLPTLQALLDRDLPEPVASLTSDALQTFEAQLLSSLQHSRHPPCHFLSVHAAALLRLGRHRELLRSLSSLSAEWVSKVDSRHASASPLSSTPASLLSAVLFNQTLNAHVRLATSTEAQGLLVLDAVMHAATTPSLQRLVTQDSLGLAVQALTQRFLSLSRSLSSALLGSADDGTVAAFFSPSRSQRPGVSPEQPLTPFYRVLLPLLSACAAIGVPPSLRVFELVIDALCEAGHLRDVVCWYAHQRGTVGIATDRCHLLRISRICHQVDLLLPPLADTPSPDELFTALVTPTRTSGAALSPLSPDDPLQPSCPAAASLEEQHVRMFCAWLLDSVDRSAMLPVSCRSFTARPLELTIRLPTSSPSSAPNRSSRDLVAHSADYLHALQCVLTRIVRARATGKHRDGVGLAHALRDPIWRDVNLTIETEPGTRAAVEEHFSTWLDRLAHQ